MISIDPKILAEDLSAFMDSFAKAVDEEMMAAAEDLASHAATNLTALDEGAGHTALAPLWTYELAPAADGVSGEVFSAAEDITFFNRTFARGAGRVKSSLYPIVGTRLLAILEGGAGEHPINPGTVNPDAKALSLPPHAGDTSSAQQWLDREKDRLRMSGPGPVPAGTIDFRGSIHHPGVAGEGHIETTAEFMLQWSESIADDAALRISGRF